MNPTFSFGKTLVFAFAALALANSVTAKETIDWHTDLTKAKHQAAAEKKMILLHFTASWCSACKEIDRFVFTNPLTARAIEEDSIPVKIDIDSQSHIAQEYGVTTIPYNILITPAGNVIKESSSPRSSDGYRELIAQAKEAAATAPQKVIEELNELRQEARRQLPANQIPPLGLNRASSNSVALQNAMHRSDSTRGTKNHRTWSIIDTRQTPQTEVLHMTKQSFIVLPTGDSAFPDARDARGFKPNHPLEGAIKETKPSVSVGSKPPHNSVAAKSTFNKFHPNQSQSADVIQAQRPLATRPVSPSDRQHQPKLAAQVAWKDDHVESPENGSKSTRSPTKLRDHQTDLILTTVKNPMVLQSKNEDSLSATAYKSKHFVPEAASDEAKFIKNPAGFNKPHVAPLNEARAAIPDSNPIAPPGSTSPSAKAQKLPSGKAVEREEADPIEASPNPKVSQPGDSKEPVTTVSMALPEAKGQAKPRAASQYRSAMENATQWATVQASWTPECQANDTSLEENDTSDESVASRQNPVSARPLQPRTPVTENSKSNAGLAGFCCVSLMEDQRWTKGSANWGCFHRGRLFLFASKEYREKFQTNPDIYSPLLGGADPVRFHESGDLVDGKREHGVYYGDEGGPTVVILFATAATRAKFEADPTEYLRSVRQAMNRLDGDLRIR